MMAERGFKRRKAKIELSETIRKSIHISSLVIPFSYRYLIGFENRKTMFLLLLAGFVLAMVIEFYRFSATSFRRRFYHLFGMILRRHERRDFTGATYLMFSAMLCGAFFSPIIAFAACAFLSIGDTMAAVVGMNLGKRKFYNNKSLEGSLACFVSTFVFGLFFVDNPWLVLTGSLSATLAEMVDIPVDDNVKIPIISGIAMTLMSIILRGIT